MIMDKAFVSYCEGKEDEINIALDKYDLENPARDNK